MADTNGSGRAIACQQVLAADASVFSIQWLVFPPDLVDRLTPGWLLDRYLRSVRRQTGSLIRPVVAETGVEFRLLGTGVSLISFTPPRVHRDSPAGSVSLAISGGFLVQRDQCERGELTFGCELVPSGLRVALQLTDYCPLLLGSSSPARWRKYLYRYTQAAIHKLVTVRFLADCYRELVDPAACLQINRVAVRDGEHL
jgi:hypothetical protein